MGLLHQVVTWYKIRHTGWQKNVVDSDTKEFQPVKFDFPLFSMSKWRMPTFLPSSMVDFYHVTSYCKRSIKVGEILFNQKI